MLGLFLVLLLPAAAEGASVTSRSLGQFRRMIKCTIPDSRPLQTFNDYGCYCGYGGSGTPMDELDRCCQIHDNCYAEAKKMEECWPIFDSPYIELYTYTCSSNTVTCSSKNDVCEMFICECDRKAAICFSKAKPNPEFKDMDQSLCH
ncbi:phospholipase A2-like [Rhinoraja longicauda]